MAYVDAVVTLKTLLDTITIPPESGGPAITKVVQTSWLDVAASKTASGQLNPTYTIVRTNLNAQALDANGATNKYDDLVQVDVWCSQLGTHETANRLREKMLAQLRAVILANRSKPDASNYYFEIASETPRDEPDQSPPLCRTMVRIGIAGLR